MANDQGVAVDLTPDIHGFKATADYTTKQFYCVKAHSTDGECILCDDGTSSHGEGILGILVGRHYTGESCDIRSGDTGLTPAICNGASNTISKGETLKTGADGALIPAGTTSDIAEFEYAEDADITTDGVKALVRRIKHSVLA